MFAHKSSSGAWSLASPCPSWPSPSSASPRCWSLPSAQTPSNWKCCRCCTSAAARSPCLMRAPTSSSPGEATHWVSFTLPPTELSRFTMWNFHSGDAAWTPHAARSELGEPAKPLRTWFSEDPQVLYNPSKNIQNLLSLHLFPLMSPHHSKGASLWDHSVVYRLWLLVGSEQGTKGPRDMVTYEAFLGS